MAHRGKKAIPVLLERDVQSAAAVLLRIVVQGVEGDGRFHRPGLASEEDDVAAGDAALHLFVEPADVRADALVGHGGGANHPAVPR